MFASSRRMSALLRCCRVRSSFLALQYLWRDQSGAARVVEQGEGPEQGDPFMPGLLAFCAAPVLFAFLGDAYIFLQPGRARAIFDIPTANSEARAGSQVNLGKTRAWNAGGAQPRR